MSISPVSDLVLDVARAADPRRVEAATRKLGEASGVDQTFSSALRAASSEGARISTSVAPSFEIHGGRSRKAEDAGDPYQRLGSLVLQKAIEQMMPAPSAATFGTGTAGSFWRSALAEQMTKAIAASVFKTPSGGVHTKAHAAAPAVAAASAAVA